MITEVPGPVLQYYDSTKPVRVQVDASQWSGAVVMQNGQPIAYASKSLTPTQEAYAQIEKEALALVAKSFTIIYTEGILWLKRITNPMRL
jgi:hypothetical protein